MELFRRNRSFILLGSGPAVLLYVLFVIYPIFRSFGYGFYEWNGLSAPKYVGVRNFLEIFRDPVFWISFRNNILVVIVSIFGQLPLGLVLAVALRRFFKGSGAYRSIFFVPMILSTVVVALLWSSLLNPQVGVVNQILKNVGLE
jgi:raffinose/stachyose/melibiose transport system permease protein